jgi:hypothetical protein
MDRAGPTSTPVPHADLLRLVRDLRPLLTQARELADTGSLWGLNLLSLHVQRALARPAILGDAQNQVDFIEVLVDAIWEAAEVDFGGPRLARAEDGINARLRRLEVVRDRLDAIADELADRLDAWRRVRWAAG